MRTLAIGDIHGCRHALETLASVVNFTKEDRINFLGDYVDRGPDTKGVLDFLLSLQNQGFDATFLRGNHEIMMLDARYSRKNASSWLSVGGEETLQSYGGEQADFSAVPESHWQFLGNLRPYVETDHHIFVHAGAAPDLEMNRQPEYRLYWEFFDFPVRHSSGKTIVCGHSSQKNGRPFSVGHAICIDTHACGERGYLTCLDVNAEVCWRANEAGEVQEDPLEAITNLENSW